MSKLSDVEGEAAETQVWLEFSVRCGYLQKEDGRRLYLTYEEIIGTVVGMINHPETWLLTSSDKTVHEAGEEYLDFLYPPATLSSCQENQPCASSS